MAERGCGVLGNMFNGDCTILFFILVFLILFMTPYGGYGGYCD